MCSQAGNLLPSLVQRMFEVVLGLSACYVTLLQKMTHAKLHPMLSGKLCGTYGGQPVCSLSLHTILLAYLGPLSHSFRFPCPVMISLDRAVC